VGVAWELLGCKGIRIIGWTLIIVYFVMYETGAEGFFEVLGRGVERELTKQS
jgi:hypothetical protein